MRDGGGQCVFASHPKNDLKIQLEPHAFHRGKSIRGSWGGGSQPDKDIPRFADMYKSGQLKLDVLLSKEYRLEQINEALDDLDNRKIVRALIKIQ